MNIERNRFKRRVIASAAALTMVGGLAGCGVFSGGEDKPTAEKSLQIEQLSRNLAWIALRDYTAHPKAWDREVTDPKVSIYTLDKMLGDDHGARGVDGSVLIDPVGQYSNGALDPSIITSFLMDMPPSRSNGEGKVGDADYLFSLHQATDGEWQATVVYPDGQAGVYNKGEDRDVTAKPLSSSQFDAVADQAEQELENHLLPDDIHKVRPIEGFPR